MKIRYLLVVMALFVLSPAIVGSESCTDCHTDESIMRSLVEAPGPKGSIVQNAIGPAGPGPLIKPDTYYKRYHVDKALLKKDPHLLEGCTPCHKGNGKASDKDEAHKGIVNRPSADLKVCGQCHDDITNPYMYSLHSTLQGFATKMSKRLGAKEEKVFMDNVFGKSCRSCHAACGDCHVSSPAVNGVRTGFIRGHAFVRKDEGKTCAVCHGGRVYPEFTGRNAASPDIHYQKGMSCTQCHKKAQLHGDGNAYRNKGMGTGVPGCRDCHKKGSEKKSVARLAHSKHDGRVTCYGCHVDGEYRTCSGCHDGKALSTKPGFILGADPSDKRILTTLRRVPIGRDSFLKAGITMEQFDALPDYRTAPVHRIRRATDRTRSCDVCHVNRKGFLTKGSVIKDGSRANEGLIFKMAPLEME